MPVALLSKIFSEDRIPDPSERAKSQTSTLLEQFPAIDAGMSESHLQGVRFFKSTQPIPRRPLVDDPGICILAQGHKTGYLGGEELRYDANNYLVTSVTMPFECETFGCPEEPLLGLYIEIEMGQLNELICGMGLQAELSGAAEKTLVRGLTSRRAASRSSGRADAAWSASIGSPPANHLPFQRRLDAPDGNWRASSGQDRSLLQRFAGLGKIPAGSFYRFLNNRPYSLV